MIKTVKEMPKEYYCKEDDELLKKYIFSEDISIINWHKKSDCLPENNGRYLVQVSNSLDGHGECYIDIWYYSKNSGFVFDGIGVTESTVVRWAELPSPYEGK